VVLVLFGASVMAVPTVDGKFDPGEGYIVGPIPLNVEGEKKGDPLIPADPGLLGTYQDPGTGNVSVVFVQPVTLVDNTYGANAIGWTGGHKLKELKGSDTAQIVFKDGSGSVVLDVTVDYIDEDGGVYSTGGVTDGDGDVDVGSAGDVLAVGTSLDYNFNTLGHSSFTTDSPLSVPDYSDPPSAPGWIFEVIYELEVDGALFAANGFGGVGVTIVHDSPNKVGKNKVYSDGDLRIVKFEDEDQDGDRGLSEILLPDWEFLVEGPNNFSQLVTTGPGGTVTLSDLELGDYTITETLKSGWVITTPNPVSVTLLEDTLVTVEFGNYEPDGNIPEPAVGSLLLLGLIAVKRRRRR